MNKVIVILLWCVLNAACAPGDDAQVRWHPVTADAPDIAVSGLPWFTENAGAFVRLPLSRQEEITPIAWQMSKHPSGARVRLKTDSTQLRLKITHGMKSAEDLSMWHMSSVAAAGIDVYVGPPGERTFWGAARPREATDAYEHLYFRALPSEMREFTLYLPIYAELARLEIGLDAQASIAPPSDYTIEKPIVFYGTSITQGGCASRGSNSFAAILGRKLNADVVNLGFSGSGCGEAVMAELMTHIDASVYVVDSVANMSAYMQTRYAAFVKILRQRRPEIPVVLMTRIHYADGFLPGYARRYADLHAPLFAVYDELKRQGDTGVYLFDAGAVITAHGDHPSVDGIHLTDVGFYRIAERLEPLLRRIIRQPDNTVR